MLSHALQACLFFAVAAQFAVAQVPPGACASNPCQNGGTCIETSTGIYTCTCPVGLLPPLCTFPSPCASQPCPSGNTCVEVVIGSQKAYQCIPPPPLNPCASQPCPNGSTCVATTNGGYVCQQPPRPCDSFPCPAGNTCVETAVGTYRCVPPPSPCASNPCTGGSTCVDALNGGFVCIPPQKDNCGCGFGGCGCGGCGCGCGCGTSGGGNPPPAGEGILTAASITALQSSVAALTASVNTAQSSIAAQSTEIAGLRQRMAAVEAARDQVLYRRRTGAATNSGLVARFDAQDRAPAPVSGQSTPSIVYNVADDTFTLSRAGQYLLDASLEGIVTGQSELSFGWQQQLPGGTWVSLPGDGSIGGANAVTRPHASSVVVVSANIPGGVTVRVSILTGPINFTRWTTGWARVIMLQSSE